VSILATGTDADFIKTIAAAVISSGVIVTALQHFLARGQRKRAEEKDDAKEQLKRERAEDERRELLAEAQRTAQRTALESSDKRYNDLKIDYTDMRSGLSGLRDATAALINVFEGFLIRMRPGADNEETYTAILQLGELGDARRAINEARRHLR
jgi:hypothetical protein